MEDLRRVQALKVRKIDDKIREHTWFDMTVFRYDGYKLTIAGSMDLSYYHTMEITFKDVLFMKGHFNWSTDTEKPVFMIPENEYELNIQYEIEQGYQLFIFKNDDMQNDVVIAAMDIDYSEVRVYYYYREGLKENERLADFVKTKDKQ